MFCLEDVFRLCSLRTAAEEQDDGVSSLGEVNAIPRAEMDAKFCNTSSYRLGVTEVSKRKTVNARDNLSGCTLVFEPSLPLLKEACLANLKHGSIVVYKIHSFKAFQHAKAQTGTG